MNLEVRNLGKWYCSENIYGDFNGFFGVMSPMVDHANYVD